KSILDLNLKDNTSLNGTNKPPPLDPASTPQNVSESVSGNPNIYIYISMC
ncbi:unnamed protein product, partial [Brassica oleracea]